MTAYCQLGKNGDVLSILPLLEHFSKRDGAPTNLVISEQYAPIVEGLDCINPVIWKGYWHQLGDAIRWAKERFEKVVVPQTYWQDGPTPRSIEHKTPSFQYDQWLRAGGLIFWDRFPLTIPRREDAKAFAESYGVDKRTILIADRGESSPFDSADRLVSVLSQEFAGTHKVLRLSSIRLDKFQDFVALYDAAAVLIVTETAHLHLAKATKTPTFALVTDKPQRWHGSAWAKNHLLHIRYSQYERRERELVESIRSIL